ncbi:MAG: hypothetical protein ACKO96_37605 [Flammeovirgaceae bacterium]
MEISDRVSEAQDNLLAEKESKITELVSGLLALVKNPCTKWIMVGVPCFLLIFLIHSNFYVALGILFLKNLLSDGWMALSIAMIQTVIDVKYKLSPLRCFSSLQPYRRRFAAVVMGEILTKVELKSEKIEELGLVLANFTAVPCLLASYCFYKCGKPYEDLKALYGFEKQ